jgi:hypothetical protein
VGCSKLSQSKAKKWQVQPCFPRTRSKLRLEMLAISPEANGFTIPNTYSLNFKSFLFSTKHYQVAFQVSKNSTDNMKSTESARKEIGTSHPIAKNIRQFLTHGQPRSSETTKGQVLLWKNCSTECRLKQNRIFDLLLCSE